jgi:hypothetical protein
MHAAGKWMGACLLLAACLVSAPGQQASSGPEVKLTCLNSDESISRHASYPITWTAANIQANTALSLRLQGTEQVRSGGVLRTVESSWLIGFLLDSTSQGKLAAFNRSAAGFSTIESGKFLWDVDQFCKGNRNGNQSVCQPGVHYRLQIILRSADDPCADNLQCAKPRSLFKVTESSGAFTFRD